MGISYPEGISIIVPTEGHVSLTIDLLRALARAREGFAPPSEALIVDSSQGDDRKAIAQACAQCDAQLIDGPRNVREKRNLGVQRARYAVVLFLDSDCRPSPDILMEHWRFYHSRDEDVPGGVLGQTVFEGPETRAWRMVRNSSLVARFALAARATTATWGPTANISFWREVLNQVGLFDTGFPFRLGGDDLDLSYRVVQAGFTLVCNPNAIVYHNRSTWNSLQAVLSRAFRWGRMEYHLYHKHPKVRVWAPPGFWGWALLVWALFCTQAIVLHDMALPVLFLPWMILSLVLFSVLSVVGTGGSTQSRARLFADSLLTAVPELTYQFGVAWEFTRHGDLRFLGSRAWFDPSAPRDNWLFEAWNFWSNLMALLICQLYMFSTH
jgi:cellulose synthase/poly-beta-1,6-N-acetylglucosamine synthase-like glycosyltransferase